MVGKIHVHYKGGRYVPLLVAQTHEHNGDMDVVYISLTHGSAVTRPLQQDSRKQDAWLDSVKWPDGKMRARFQPEQDFSQFELAELRRLHWGG